MSELLNLEALRQIGLLALMPAEPTGEYAYLGSLSFFNLENLPKLTPNIIELIRDFEAKVNQ